VVQNIDKPHIRRREKVKVKVEGNCLQFEVFAEMVTKIYISRRTTSYNPFKIIRRFKGTCFLRLQSRRISQTSALLATCFTLIYCLTYSSCLKLETCFSETSVDFQLTTMCYIPRYITLRGRKLFDSERKIVS
jgi:hypothetical protein